MPVLSWLLDAGRSRITEREPDDQQAEAVHRQDPASVRTRPRGLAQPKPIPRRLRAAARPAQPLEPILIPKLRIEFADFPYLHCSIPPEAVHLGDLLRIWVRSGMKITLTPSDFQGPTQVHRTPQETRCFTETTSLSPGEPIPGSPFLTKKRELFPGLLPTSLSSFALPLWTIPERIARLHGQVREY